jgi:uncharacterized repeat protein (TIGR01451 family)
LPDADASRPFMHLQLADGFSYSGNSKIDLNGRQSPCEPVIDGQSLNWDLAKAIEFCRHVVINEFDQNPPGSDTKREWIELFNPTSQMVDISDWCLMDSYSERTVSIPSGTAIAPYSYQIINWTNSTLINSYAISISLLDSSGQVVDRTLAAKDDKNNNLCWSRNSNGRDLDSDLDWKFQAGTPGFANGGSTPDLYSGEAVHLQFNLTAGCTAENPAWLLAETETSAGKIAASPVQILVNRANLSLSITPDRFDIGKGDLITWTILLDNDGNGTAHDAVVNATLSPGLQPQGIFPAGLSWSFPSIAPGEQKEIRLRAKATSTMNCYFCALSAQWGSGPCQEMSIKSGLDPRTAIALEPDQPRRLSIGETADYQIFADLPKGARSLWINDTTPRGLKCNVSSISLQGPALQRNLLIENADGSQQICWFFGDINAARQIEITYNCQLENIAENQDGLVLAAGKATMSWQESGTMKTDADESGVIAVVEPDLMIEIQPSRLFVSPDERIAFTISICHSPGSQAGAFDLDLQATLPDELVYEPGSARVLAGPDAQFDENTLVWRIASLDFDESSNETSVIRFNATCTAKPGELMTGSASITWCSQPGENPAKRNGSGGINDYRREAKAKTSTMSLTIRKTADPNPAQVGKTLVYTLTCECLGSTAHNVTISDELDWGVEFLSSDPAPSTDCGRKINWTCASINANEQHTISLKVLVKDDLPDGAMLQNRFSAECDELNPGISRTIFTPVENATLLDVNKTALQKAVRRGEDVDYIITVCNRGGRPATNITVRDIFASAVEIISIWPGTSVDGSWHFPSLAPGQCLQMGLTVRVPRTDFIYESSGNISGEGFIRSFRNYCTSRPADSLINRVYVTSDQMQLSGSAEVQVLAEDGTGLYIREHGSGDYESQETLRFLTENRSIGLERHVKAEHHPSALILPGFSQPQIVSSFWREEVRAKNGITNTTMKQSHQYASRLADESLFYLDENQSNMDTKSDFRGMSHLEMRKLSDGFAGPGGETFSAEDYAGEFSLTESIEDLGQGMILDRYASGQGYLTKDTENRGQRSYESGTGACRVEEEMDTFTGFMKKDLDAVHHDTSLLLNSRTSLNVSQPWAEGLISRTPMSLISEEYSSALRLEMRAVAASPGERESEARFSGVARMRTDYEDGPRNNASRNLKEDETLMGDYELKRKIILSGAAKYNRPHLNLLKHGQRIKDVAAYSIIICNDGNVALGPLFVQDVFPPGSGFINASLRPNRMDESSSNWTILHLAIGDTISIGINLDVEGCQGDIINRALVTGIHSRGQVTAQNHSIIAEDFLGPCLLAKPPDGSASPDPSASCACQEVQSSGVTDYLDPMEAKLQWGEGCTEDGLCPLCCPALDGAIAPVKR